MGSHSLLQGIFPTQGSNPGLLHCRWILCQLRYKRSPRILEWIAYPFSSISLLPMNVYIEQKLTHRYGKQAYDISQTLSRDASITCQVSLQIVTACITSICARQKHLPLQPIFTWLLPDFWFPISNLLCIHKALPFQIVCSRMLRISKEPFFGFLTLLLYIIKDSGMCLLS